MKLPLLLLLLSFIILNTNAQTAEPDTLKPETQIPADSTSNKEDEGGEEEEQEEEQEEETELNIFKYRVGADGNLTSGNVNRFLFRLTSNFDWDLHKSFRFSSSPSFIYGKQNNLLNEREFFTDLRASLLHERKLYYLAFGSYEKSNLRNIHFRWTGAAGVGLKLLQKPNAYISVTNVLLYEETDFQELNDIKLWRNSARLFGEYTFAEKKFGISHTVFFQPSISEKKNLRWNGNLTLKYQLSTHISLRSVFENSYESLVVPGRKNNDLRWTFGVSFDGAK
ncbi:MAG: DUF481 domain-containing protein [Spirosomaceae bacterium]|nr:DUF481 domain-containing protein [Spirosomataceae bacterium]